MIRYHFVYRKKPQPLTESYAQEAYELLELCPACQKNGNLTLSEIETHTKHPIQRVIVRTMKGWR